jgi:nitrate/nitrite transporter NarK
LPVFWNLPTAFLGAAAAAGGIAFINSVGNASGYLAPQMVGLLRDTTGSYQLPMLIVGGLVLLAGALVPVAAHQRQRVAARA